MEFSAPTGYFTVMEVRAAYGAIPAPPALILLVLGSLILLCRKRSA